MATFEEMVGKVLINFVNEDGLSLNQGNLSIDQQAFPKSLEDYRSGTLILIWTAQFQFEPPERNS